jgi:hypothetical protein
MTPIHDDFDADAWREIFSLRRLREDARRRVAERKARLPHAYSGFSSFEDHVKLLEPRPEMVVGPEQATVNLLLREERLPRASTLGEKAPTDVFVYAVGEPRHPAATKYGGRAYVRRGAAWPSNADGRPLTFVGQLCFADSRDLARDLMYDGISMFVDGGDPAFDAHHYAFYSIGDDMEAVDPPAEARLAPSAESYHGRRLRTFDLPDLVDSDLEERDGGVGAVWHGTKIGGVAPLIQPHMPNPGRFIGAFGSIKIDPGMPWRFVGREEPYREYGTPFMFGDMGSVFVYVKRRFFGDETFFTSTSF